MERYPLFSNVMQSRMIDSYRHIFTISAPFKRVNQSKNDPLKATGTIIFPYVLTFIFLDINELSKYFT